MTNVMTGGERTTEITKKLDKTFTPYVKRFGFIRASVLRGVSVIYNQKTLNAIANVYGEENIVGFIRGFKDFQFTDEDILYILENNIEPFNIIKISKRNPTLISADLLKETCNYEHRAGIDC
ncbi:MAG: hypothetical protein GY828_07915 [Candidatus Gracilibacteria bacterium]|nr:hypothetical protein [Candidatus Gracilibacteria bacterium]